MTHEKETAAPIALGTGGEVVSKALQASYYLIPTLNATDIAAAILGARFGLTECMARVVCELSGIGGRRT
jgi:hypothetical protein